MTLALVFFKPTALTAIFLLVRKMQTIKYYFFFFLGCYLLLSFLNGICFLFYGFGISRKLLTIISETNHNEVIEFLPELIATLKPLVFSVKFLVTLIIFVLLWRLLPVIPSRFYLPTVITISLFGLSYFIHVCATAEFGKTTHSVLARTYKSAQSTMHSRQENKALIKQRKNRLEPANVSSYHKAEKIVIVIGGSASKSHLSLYGYPLPTTPFST